MRRRRWPRACARWGIRWRWGWRWTGSTGHGWTCGSWPSSPSSAWRDCFFNTRSEGWRRAPASRTALPATAWALGWGWPSWPPCTFWTTPWWRDTRSRSGSFCPAGSWPPAFCPPMSTGAGLTPRSPSICTCRCSPACSAGPEGGGLPVSRPVSSCWP